MTRFTLAVAASTALLTILSSVAAAQRAQTDLETGLVDGNSQFACELYRHLAKEDGNLFFSPYSISNALAMTYAGARGQTAADMARTLHIPFEEPRLHQAFAGLIQQLNKPGQKRTYQLSIANRLWGQKNYGFSPEFVQLCQGAYGAGLKELDFTRATEASRQAINEWVEKETQNRIKDLLPPGSILDDTRLVLTNAIYFKARWLEMFNDKATKREDFKPATGKPVQIDMMNTVEVLNLLDGEDFQMVELPYEGRELSMCIVLPRKIDGLPAVEKQLTVDNLQKWRKQMKGHMVTLALPKFTFSAEFKLKKALSDMGMSIAFSQNADFSGMTTGEKLFIDAVIHKAFVAVDEKGTEAAAATAVTMRPTSVQVAPNATLRADHPFLFLIRENASGSILFMGRLSTPPVK
jgi:serine protease inhibitor